MLAYVSGAAFEGQPSIEQLQPKVEPPSGSNLLTPNVVASTLPPVETPPKDPQSPTIRAADDEESREMARKRLKCVAAAAIGGQRTAPQWSNADNWPSTKVPVPMYRDPHDGPVASDGYNISRYRHLP